MIDSNNFFILSLPLFIFIFLLNLVIHKKKGKQYTFITIRFTFTYIVDKLKKFEENFSHWINYFFINRDIATYRKYLIFRISISRYRRCDFQCYRNYIRIFFV